MNGKKHLKQLFINASLVILSILFTLILIEIVLRVTGYVGDIDRQRMTFSQYMGDVEKDSWVFDLIEPHAPQSTMRINESTVSVKKKPGTTRILFIGDSGTVGTGVEYKQSFPFQFEEYFAETHPDQKLEVINAGVYGMTTIAEYHLLRDKLLVLNPDIIILGLFMANDINLNLLHNAKKVQLEKNSKIFSFIQATKENSALMHYIFLKLLAVEQKHQFLPYEQASTYLPAEFSLRDENGLNFASYFEGEIATYYKDYSSMADFAFEVLESVLYDIREVSEKNNAKFHIVLIPTASAITGRLEMLAFPKPVKRIRQSQGKHKIDLTKLDFTKPAAEVLSICRKLEITCVDPTSELQKEGLSVILPGDDHLSVKGHEIVARKLARSPGIVELKN